MTNRNPRNQTRTAHPDEQWRRLMADVEAAGVHIGPDSAGRAKVDARLAEERQLLRRMFSRHRPVRSPELILAGHAAAAAYARSVGGTHRAGLLDIKA